MEEERRELRFLKEVEDDNIEILGKTEKKKMENDRMVGWNQNVEMRLMSQTHKEEFLLTEIFLRKRI